MPSLTIDGREVNVADGLEERLRYDNRFELGEGQNDVSR